MAGASVSVETLSPYLVDVDGLQGQLPQAFPAVPIALGGGGHAPTPGLASRSVLEVHGAGLGASGDKEKPGGARVKAQNPADAARPRGTDSDAAGRTIPCLLCPEWSLHNP